MADATYTPPSYTPADSANIFSTLFSKLWGIIDNHTTKQASGGSGYTHEQEMSTPDMQRHLGDVVHAASGGQASDADMKGFFQNVLGKFGVGPQASGGVAQTFSGGSGNIPNMMGTGTVASGSGGGGAISAGMMGGGKAGGGGLGAGASGIGSAIGGMIGGLLAGPKIDFKPVDVPMPKTAQFTAPDLTAGNTNAMGIVSTPPSYTPVQSNLMSSQTQNPAVAAHVPAGYAQNPWNQQYGPMGQYGQNLRWS